MAFIILIAAFITQTLTWNTLQRPGSLIDHAYCQRLRKYCSNHCFLKLEAIRFVQNQTQDPSLYHPDLSCRNECSTVLKLFRTSVSTIPDIGQWSVPQCRLALLTARPLQISRMMEGAKFTLTTMQTEPCNRCNSLKFDLLPTKSYRTRVPHIRIGLNTAEHSQGRYKMWNPKGNIISKLTTVRIRLCIPFLGQQ